MDSSLKSPGCENAQVTEALVHLGLPLNKALILLGVWKYSRLKAIGEEIDPSHLLDII